MLTSSAHSNFFMGISLQSTCCTWIGGEELNNQKQITLENKTRPTLFSKSISIDSPEDQQLKEGLFVSPTTTNTPKKKCTRNRSDLVWGSKKKMHQRKASTFINLRSSEPVKNPLQKLKKLQKKGVQRSFLGIGATKSLSLDQLTPNNQFKNIQNLSTIFGTSQQYQNQQQKETPGQNELRNEVQAYRKEYEQLLREETELRNKKETNLAIYRALLNRLQLTKQDIILLERARKEEIQFLRTHLQQILAQNEEEQS